MMMRKKGFDKLIKTHPSYYNGYLSRSQFWLEKKDTLKAIGRYRQSYIFRQASFVCIRTTGYY